MGTKNKTAKPAPRGRHPPNLADALFSRTQQRVLGLLFGQPARNFYANEIIQLAGGGNGAVQRELARLTQSGLITDRTIGKRKHFQANPQSPLFSELHSIVVKTTALAEPLREALRELTPKIVVAFVYGSVAKGEDTASSDIDLMLVADDLVYGDLFAALESANTRLGRTVNPTILSRKELTKRIKADSAFVTRVLSQPKIWIFGSEQELRN